MGTCYTYTDDCDLEYTFTAILIILAFLILNVTFYDMLRSFYCPTFLNTKRDTTKTPKRPVLFFQITAISAYICGIGCIICDFVHIIEGWVIPMPLRDSYFKPTRTAANICAFQSYLLTDILILGRLYYSFHLSDTYKLSHFLLSFICFILLGILICDLLYLVILISDNDFGKTDILLSFIIFEVCASIIMSLTFSKKLHQVLSPYDDFQSDAISEMVEVETTNTTTRSITGADSNVRISVNKLNPMASVQLNQMQINLLNLSVKNTIITGIAALYFAGRFGYRQFAARYDVNQDIEIIWMISYVSRTFVFITNSIAIYFGFVLSKNKYHCIFGKCHICLYKLCAKIAKREITNNVLDSIRQQSIKDLSVNTNTK